MSLACCQLPLSTLCQAAHKSISHTAMWSTGMMWSSHVYCHTVLHILISYAAQLQYHFSPKRLCTLPTSRHAGGAPVSALLCRASHDTQIHAHHNFVSSPLEVRTICTDTKHISLFGPHPTPVFWRPDFTQPFLNAVSLQGWQRDCYWA